MFEIFATMGVIAITVIINFIVTSTAFGTALQSSEAQKKIREAVRDVLNEEENQ